MTESHRITRDEVVHVAQLARLSLTDAEIEEFTGQLGDILEHAADIEALDVGDIEPTSHPLPMVNVLRPDVRSSVARPRPAVVTGAGGRGRGSSGSRRSWGRSRERPRDRGGGEARGERSAVDVVDEHLARIDATDAEIHAFNLVTT